MAEVVFESVNKIYASRRGDVHAVRDLSMRIADGEFVALLGPSGCGKTSTLRMVVGLEEITSGRILFDGATVNRLTPQERNVAMAFETYALYPNLTVAENLGFPLEVRGVARAEREREVRRIAELLAVVDILESRPPQLSGGQQQRVSLGRALIREPSVFILDEVMSHVDAHLKFRMLSELKRIYQSVRRTMVYVTHDQVEALALAERVAVMHEGRLLQFGTRNELYNAPANRFVAGFIGEPPTNFMTVRPAAEDRGLRLRDDRSELVFEASPERAAKIGNGDAATYILGIRPQNLFVDPARGEASVSATVDINEYLGEQNILTLKAGQTMLRAIAPVDYGVRGGDTIDLFYRRNDVMIFDAATELLLQ